MSFPWLRRRPSAFVRNRPILRSPVMARLDALFADPVANASIYEAILADPTAPLTAEYLREVFAKHSPDSAVEGVGATSEDVITHVFDHILGPNSWWGPAASGWRGGELLTAAYRDAIGRAQVAGNIPISTFHLQASPDGQFQLQVLETGRVIVVIIATPPVPGSASGPRDFKLTARKESRFGPVDDRMSEVGSYTFETVPG